MRNTPAYPLRSVDHALELITLLVDAGSMRITTAATLLGVSPSTAHRLMTALVHRDFAEQTDDRSYRPGPALRLPQLQDPDVVTMCRRFAPLLDELSRATGESVNLSVLIGARIRIVASVESSQALRVGDRRGLVLPAYVASGGVAMLAGFSNAEVTRVLKSDLERRDIDAMALMRRLTRVRRLGYAVNNQQTEVGVTAIGVSVLDRVGSPRLAVSLALPSARFTPRRLPGLVALLRDCAGRCQPPE